MKKKIYFNYLLVLFVLFFSYVTSFGQTAIRYQSTIRGGATMFGNSWFYNTTGNGVPPNPPTTTLGIPTTIAPLVPDVDSDAGTTLSTSADLILPAGSTIVKAFLAIERGKTTANVNALTSVKFKRDGAPTYTTINATSALVARSNNNFHQTIFDITSLIPANGYVTTAGGGSTGRYFLADPLPAYTSIANAVVGGWSIIVVYSNANSKFRNITVADNWNLFSTNPGGTPVANTDVTGINVPSTGAFNAVVGVTGSYGDRAYPDRLAFGLASGALTDLVDPTTGSATDLLNSTIGWAAQNNVSADGGPAISGNITTRNPISQHHIYGPAESWEYDSDIINASGILTNSTTSQTIRLSQISTNGDVLFSGSYFISVDAQEPVKLTKSVAPTTITEGGTATYTFTLNNTATGSVAQGNLSFTDALPSGLQIAAVPNVVVTGLTGGVVTASPGGTAVGVSGYSIAANTTATITVRVTNVPGQTNTSCGSNPSAFTNSSANIFGVANNIDNQIGNVCLVVTPSCAAGTTAPPVH